MAWISSDITYQDAISRGLPVWEVLYEDWGNAIVSTSTNASFPPIGSLSIPTVYGVSIGPRSTVDRAFVSYDRQKIVSSAYDYLRPVSVGAPLLFTQPAATPAPVSISNLNSPPYSAASVAVFNSLSPAGTGVLSTDPGFRFSTFHNSLGVTTTFGVGGVGAVLVKPLLHLYFHLKPDFVPLTQRAPSIARNQTIVGAARELIASVPVCGRKRVFVTAVIAGSGCVFDVGLVQQTTPGVAAATGEVLAGTVTTSTTNQPVRIVINPADADFVNLYTTAGGGGTNLYWTVRAED